MTSFQSQHRRTLTNGVVVERLPLGFAAGRWWASFAYAGTGPSELEPGAREWVAIGHSAQVHDPEGLLECVGGGGGGNIRYYEHTWELVDHGASRARVSYYEDDEEVGSELLTLDQTDQTGCFAVRLTDGSLVERLPVGRAHGGWRLRFVRSDVPTAERALDQDPDGVPMLDKRFISLRSTGPVGRTSAACSFGGPIQPFGVDVPDTLTRLEVDYLFDDEVVGTEVLLLPDRDG